MIEARGLIDTEVNAVDVHELIDAELDTVSGGLFGFFGSGGITVAEQVSRILMLDTSSLLIVGGFLLASFAISRLW